MAPACEARQRSLICPKSQMSCERLTFVLKKLKVLNVFDVVALNEPGRGMMFAVLR